MCYSVFIITMFVPLPYTNARARVTLHLLDVNDIIQIFLTFQLGA